jgi:FkbH-like protein
LSVGFLRPDPVPERNQAFIGEPTYFAERIRWQSVLFAAALERRALLGLQAPWPLSRRRIRVHRNHAVETALTVARPFLEFAGIAADWVVGDYDDALTFSALERVDLEIIWLDYARFAERMQPEEIADWLVGRLAVLRSHTASPVLVIDWDAAPEGSSPFSTRLSNAVAGDHDVYLADRTELFRTLGEQFFDTEREALTGTRMSAEGAAATARLLGSRWLPALLKPRVKAIVVDLDNTLFDGVLGEDGVDSLILTKGHEELQNELGSLHNSGLFLGLLSRNDAADVKALFEACSDFPLRWEDFDARSLSWEPKSAGLRDIASSLRIDPSTVLFIDDNPGELLEATLAIPGLSYLHATEGGDDTARALHYFPGLWASRISEIDELRTPDLRANDERERLLSHVGSDLAAYYRELGVTLTVSHNKRDQLARVAELSGKTNQFNLAFSRYSLTDVQALAEDDAHQISTAGLEDRLTDSGVVAMAVVRRQGETLFVEELCISCRALGRRLEDLMVTQMVASGPLFEGSSRVIFRFIDGPRNHPARRWLEEFRGASIPAADEAVSIAVDVERVLRTCSNPDVRIKVLP